MRPQRRSPRRPRTVVAVAALVAVLSAMSACAGSDGAASGVSSAATDANPGGTSGSTAPRSVVERSLPPSVCMAPTTPPHGVTTTVIAPNAWPPPGYDRSALVRVDLLTWADGVAHVRWQAGQGVDPCETDLRADTAWVLDASGYQEIHGAEIGDFVVRRLRDLGATSDGVPFLVEVSDDGQTARQLGEIPPG